MGSSLDKVERIPGMMGLDVTNLRINLGLSSHAEDMEEVHIEDVPWYEDPNQSKSFGSVESMMRKALYSLIVIAVAIYWCRSVHGAGNADEFGSLRGLWCLEFRCLRCLELRCLGSLKSFGLNSPDRYICSVNWSWLIYYWSRMVCWLVGYNSLWSAGFRFWVCHHGHCHAHKHKYLCNSISHVVVLS